MPVKSPKDAKPEVKSGTSPQYSSMLRKIMLIDRIAKLRNDTYQEKLASFMSTQKERQANLSKEELKGLEAGFTRQFYRHEYLAISEYQGILSERLEMMQRKQDEGLSPAEQEKLEKLDFYADMTPESYAASKLFSDDVIGKLKKEYPEVNKAISAEIKEIGGELFPELSGQQAARPATVELFNKKYPELRGQLQQMMSSSDPAMKADGKAGLGLLRWSSALANPSGFLISKAVGAILKSDTFKPLVGQIGVSVTRVAEKTGLTGWAKKLMSNLSDVSAKRVAVGVAGCCAVGMMALGFMDQEGAGQLYADLKEGIGGLADDAVAYANNELLANMSEYGSLDAALNEDVPAVKTPLVDAEGVIDGLRDSKSAYVSEMLGHLDQVAGNEGATIEPVTEQVAQKGGSELASSQDVFNALTPEEPAPPTIADVNVVEGQVASVNVEVPTSLPAEPITVEKGDTLSELVEARFQAAGKPYNYALIDSYVEQIAQSNGIADENLIRVGQVIEFPEMEKVPSIISAEALAKGAECITPVHPEQHTARVAQALAQTGMTDPVGQAITQAVQQTQELHDVEYDPTMDPTFGESVELDMDDYDMDALTRSSPGR